MGKVVRYKKLFFVVLIVLFTEPGGKERGGRENKAMIEFF